MNILSDKLKLFRVARRAVRASPSQAKSFQDFSVNANKRSNTQRYLLLASRTS